MRSAVTRLILVPSTRRAWQQQQQQAGRGGTEAFNSSSISPPSPSPLSSTSTSSSSTPTPFHLLDRVFVSRMPFFARHGVHPAEAELGQRFEVDAEVFVDGLARSVLAGEEGSNPANPNANPTNPYPSPPADSVERTFDYSRIHAVARSVVQDGPRAQLVETLAARIADALLKEGDGSGTTFSSPFFVVGARVRVTKPGAPIQGVFGEAGCEVVRWKEGRR